MVLFIKSISFPLAAPAAAFVTFCESNAKALLTACSHQKVLLRPTGWYGALPRCLRTAPQPGALFVKSFPAPSRNFHRDGGDNGDGFLAPLTSSSPSSHLGRLKRQLHPPPGVIAGAFISDMIFAHEPPRIDIQPQCQSVRLHVQPRQGKKL